MITLANLHIFPKTSSKIINTPKSSTTSASLAGISPSYSPDTRPISMINTKTSSCIYLRSIRYTKIPLCSYLLRFNVLPNFPSSMVCKIFEIYPLLHLTAFCSALNWRPSDPKCQNKPGITISFTYPANRKNGLPQGALFFHLPNKQLCTAIKANVYCNLSLNPWARRYNTTSPLKLGCFNQSTIVCI